MKRFLLATGAGVAAVAAITASAATLGGFDNEDIGSTIGGVAGCSQDAIDITSYDSFWDDTLKAYVVEGLTATVPALCANKGYSVSLLDDTETRLAWYDDTLVGTSLNANFNQPAIVEDYTNIAIVIGG